jgi:hypothetical protein
MTVSELITELKRWPADLEVHLDVDSPFEGDRVVRGVSGVRHQSGYYALAIDAQSYNDTQLDQKQFIDCDHDIVPR